MSMCLLPNVKSPTLALSARLAVSFVPTKGQFRSDFPSRSLTREVRLRRFLDLIDKTQPLAPTAVSILSLFSIFVAALKFAMLRVRCGGVGMQTSRLMPVTFAD